MTSFETAGRSSAVREDDRTPVELGLAALSRLRPRAQFTRIGNRCAIPSLGGGHVYFVAKGVVGIEAGANGSDVRVITSLLYPGDVLAPDLQPPLPGLSLIAQRACEFWKLTTSILAEEGARDNHVWHAIFSRLNDQNARLQLHAAEMSILNSEEKVAAFLIESGTRLGVSSGGMIAFELPLSRYSIADYLSLNADTISRTFSALGAARIIERRGRFQIVVRDWSALLAKCPMSDTIIAAHGPARSQIAR